MKITVITVCYNSDKTIEETILSVVNQTYKNYEYLIIDGKSTDKTVEIIQKYENVLKGKLKWISEKDKGLYDAMNKGIRMASGEIIGILNSDDIFANESTLETIARTVKEKNCDGIYSDLIFMDPETMKIPQRIFKSKKGNYKFGWFPPHPTLYVKKEIYNKYGMYNQDFKIAADYDFMLRIMKEKVDLQYIKKTLIYMRSGGVSTKGIQGYYESFKESLQVLKVNKIKNALLVNIMRTIKIVWQSIKAKFQRIMNAHH